MNTKNICFGFQCRPPTGYRHIVIQFGGFSKPITTSGFPGNSWNFQEFPGNFFVIELSQVHNDPGNFSL